MATGMQTDEYLSVNDLPHLLNEICPISPDHVLSFGLQLQIEYTKIQEFEMHYNNKVAILGRILYKALNRHPPLTKKDIVKALRALSVQEDRLANQIETNYIPLSQRGPQHVGPGSLPVTQTGLSHQMSLQSAHQLPPSAPPHATSENITQTLTPSWPNTSQSFASQQLTTELPRTNQPQSNLDQVDQSHQLPASLSMPPPPAPQTSKSFSLQPKPGPSLTSMHWTPQMSATYQLTPSAHPQTHILPPSNQPSPWLENSQLAASQQFATQLPRPKQPQPNPNQVGQSSQLPAASQRMSMPPQPGPQLQHWSQLQFPSHHPNYQHPFPLFPNPPMHRPHESQSFPFNAHELSSYNQYSSLHPFNAHYFSVVQPQYSQPYDNQVFSYHEPVENSGKKKVNSEDSSLGFERAGSGERQEEDLNEEVSGRGKPKIFEKDTEVQQEDKHSFNDGIEEQKQVSESEKLRSNVFECFYGRLCLEITNPVETAAQLQMKGLISKEVMKTMMKSPESQQEKTISLVDGLDEKIKSQPHCLFTVIEVLLESVALQKIGNELLTEVGK